MILISEQKMTRQISGDMLLHEQIA